MSNESKIPVLQDLIFQGQSDSANRQSEKPVDENKEVEIEQDETNSETGNEQQTLHAEIPEELVPEDLSVELSDEIEPSNQQQIIDEEIRRIMEKHMDKAYKEIKMLLHMDEAYKETKKQLKDKVS